jgi:hypothetical protein
LDVCALLDGVGNDGCDEDDNIANEFWKISWAVLDLKGCKTYDKNCGCFLIVLSAEN